MIWAVSGCDQRQATTAIACRHALGTRLIRTLDLQSSELIAVSLEADLHRLTAYLAVLDIALPASGQIEDDGVELLFRAARAVLGEWTARLIEEVGDGFPEKVTAFREGMAVHGRYRESCPDCGAPIYQFEVPLKGLVQGCLADGCGWSRGCCWWVWLRLQDEGGEAQGKTQEAEVSAHSK